jgi:hypothetical protein
MEIPADLSRLWRRDRSLLTRLSHTFELRPWADPAKRLQALEDRYGHLLDVASSPDA